MSEKITNDQGHIIEAIKKGNRHYVWEAVKFVGTMYLSSIDERFLVFNKAFDNFDPHRNNNFILFYRKYLNYQRMSNNDREFSGLTNNRNVINTLMRELSTPTDDEPPLIKDLKQWTNMGD